VVYDGVPQILSVVAIDGVPQRSHATSLFVAIGQRVEFMVYMPRAGVKSARLMTSFVFPGPQGDFDPSRPLLRIIPHYDAPDLPVAIGQPSFGVTATPSPFNLSPSRTRLLHFSEWPIFPNDPKSPFAYAITEEGAQEEMYDPMGPPAISVKVGTVEDWTIENRANETHVFHIHQIHFKLLMRDGVSLPSSQQEIRDTIHVPFWDQVSPTFPSVTIRMDFTNPLIAGVGVYHCHILHHEDNGMMQQIAFNA